jgi:prophage regulatory protein
MQSNITTLIGIPGDRMLRVKDVLAVVPLGRSTLFAKIAAGEFPAPVKLSPRVVCWRADTIRNYLAGGAS